MTDVKGYENLSNKEFEIKSVSFLGRKEKGSWDRGIPVWHQDPARQAVTAGDQAAGSGRGEREGGGEQGHPGDPQAGAGGGREEETQAVEKLRVILINQISRTFISL